MQNHWTQPATYDPREFDTRFRPEVLDFWLPHFIKLADLAVAQRVLDLGCGTGGFARAIAQRVQADVIGVDVAAHLLRYAAAQSPALPIRWILGRAQDLPLAEQSADRVLLSLVLHQIDHRQRAIQEVYRVLHLGGRLLVRTVAPEVALQAWVPFRFFPKVAQIEAARLPAIDAILGMCRQAGFKSCTRARCVVTPEWTSTRSPRTCGTENGRVINCSPTRNWKTACAASNKSGAPSQGIGLIRNPMP